MKCFFRTGTLALFISASLIFSACGSRGEAPQQTTAAPTTAALTEAIDEPAAEAAAEAGANATAAATDEADAATNAGTGAPTTAAPAMAAAPAEGAATGSNPAQPIASDAANPETSGIAPGIAPDIAPGAVYNASDNGNDGDQAALENEAADNGQDTNRYGDTAEPLLAPDSLTAPIPRNDEEYTPIKDNYIKTTEKDPFLTFSLKVDTASYSNVARYINSGSAPPEDAVRVEEMINYFNYDTPVTENDSPFGFYVEAGPSPFNTSTELAFIHIKTKDVNRSQLPRNNLTFLIDTSGSMDSYDKLPLLKLAFGLLIDNLTADDVISIVTYAGDSQVVLDSVGGDQKDRISKAVNSLGAGGSTAGASGINTAYALAEKNYDPNANNRIILATDGDFNVGVSDVGELERLITEKRNSGVYLTILGFGTENLKDNKMVTLAKNGNGNYSYIDNAATARKVLIDEMGANLYTVADDVKAQIEFNPVEIESYRLIGYENMMMTEKDFADDTKDAGEIGVGADVVIMLEYKRTDPSSDIALLARYGGKPPKTRPENSTDTEGVYSKEMFTVNIRYKKPGENVSKLIVEPVPTGLYTDKNSTDFNFAVSVAGFGQMLRNSPYKGRVDADWALATASFNMGEDRGGYRRDFVDLILAYIRMT